MPASVARIRRPLTINGFEKMLMLLGSRQPFALAMRRCLDELSCTSPPIRLRHGPSPVGHDDRSPPHRARLHGFDGVTSNLTKNFVTDTFLRGTGIELTELTNSRRRWACDFPDGVALPSADMFDAEAVDDASFLRREPPAQKQARNFVIASSHRQESLPQDRKSVV